MDQNILGHSRFYLLSRGLPWPGTLGKLPGESLRAQRSGNGMENPSNWWQTFVKDYVQLLKVRLTSQSFVLSVYLASAPWESRRNPEKKTETLWPCPLVKYQGLCGLGCVTHLQNNPSLDLSSERLCSVRAFHQRKSLWAHLGQGMLCPPGS